MKKIIIFLTAAVMIAALGCGGGKKTDSEGVYVGQSVSEFISIFEKQYKVVKGVISLEGADYPTYDVFENDELLFQVELHSDRPEIVYRIHIYSPNIKTDKDIGVGSTYAEMKSKYNIAGVSEEIGLNVWVEELSVTFIMSVDYQPNIDWGRLNKETMPESATIQEILLWNDDVLLTTDKRIIARNAVETDDAAALTTETAERTGATETMTMTANIAEITIMLAGEGKATIDWGDGRVVETDELEEFNSYTFEGAQEYRHQYAGATARRITITGAVTMLTCSNAGLTAIDVSQNPALLYLYCADNRLTALDVSRHNSLIELDVSNNQLTALDVSRNTELWNLRCSGNQLTALDVSRNTALYYFYCDDNQLTALNLKNNTALHGINVSNNLFTTAALNALFETLHDDLIT